MSILALSSRMGPDGSIVLIVFVALAGPLNFKERTLRSRANYSHLRLMLLAFVTLKF